MNSRVLRPSWLCTVSKMDAEMRGSFRSRNRWVCSSVSRRMSWRRGPLGEQSSPSSSMTIGSGTLGFALHFAFFEDAVKAFLGGGLLRFGAMANEALRWRGAAHTRLVTTKFRFDPNEV